MSQELRYYGEIASLNGHAITVEIWKEGAELLDMLTFPADSPVVIEWAEADKLEPVLSSSCTLSIESMTDRQFLDELYTIESGSVTCKIYRDDVLYWSGTLDPEQYEEPYYRLENYDVTITFNDFARLERIKYDRSDIVPVKTLIEWIISQSGVEYGSIIWKTSTKTFTGANTAFTGSYIKSANWYDEEGEAMSLREVLDETLRVFSLRCKQKAGNIYIYDLHTIYSETPSQVVWDGADSAISADKVYNDVEVTWSPYDSTNLIDSEIKYKTGTSVTTWQFPQNDTPTKSNTDTYYAINSYYGTTSRSTSSDTRKDWWNRQITYQSESFYLLKNREGFEIRISNSGSGVTLGGNAAFFKVSPQYSGQEDEGVLIYLGRFDLLTIYENHLFSDHQYVRWTNNRVANMFGTLGNYQSQGNDALTFARFYVPTLPNSSQYFLRLKVETLIDCRINPYESDSMSIDHPVHVIDHVYIPYNLKLECDDGNTYYWDTSELFDSNDKEVSVITASSQWSAAASRGTILASGYSAALHYTSNIASPADGDGNLGWNTNTVMMPKYSTSSSDSVQAIERGEYIKLPTTGGWCTLTISDILDSYGTNGNYDHYLNAFVGWVAIKSVSVELVDKYGNSINTEDVVTNATLNRSAKETLDIDTVLDVSETIANTAKGMLVDVDGRPLAGFQRAGSTGTLAQLMCNTIYSQYATRKLAISGTVQLLDTPGILSEANTDGKFILESEAQNLREDTSSIRMVQFTPDEYAPLPGAVPETMYNISKNLAGVLLVNGASSVASGSSYTSQLRAVLGYTMTEVTVTMGGTDITSTAYSNGTISIPSVTGDIVIVAIASGPQGTTMGPLIPSDYADGIETSDGDTIYVIINKTE